MTEKSRIQELIVSYPLIMMIIFPVIALTALIGVALILDQQNATRDQQLMEQLMRPPGEPSGTVPTTLPRQIVTGQTVYVPVYSHIIVGDGRRLPLAGTLGIRNTDNDQSLTIASVKYYDTEGKLLRDFLTEPLQLNPLGSTSFFVKQSDLAGGSGANFVVEWVSDQPVYAPLIEIVMAAREGTGITSFVRSGQVIKQLGKQDEPEK